MSMQKKQAMRVVRALRKAEERIFDVLSEMHDIATIEGIYGDFEGSLQDLEMAQADVAMAVALLRNTVLELPSRSLPE